MSKDLVLYTHPMTRGRIVRWMLEEVGVPYTVAFLTAPDALKSPAYLALNAMGKVPALRHGDAVITETAAICAYLADAFPEAGLAPPSGERGAYYRWLFFAAGPVEAATTNKSLGVAVSPEQSRFVGYGNYATTMETLEQAVSQSEYVAGAAFSAADVYVGSQIGFGLQFNSIEARPALVEYWDRIKDRPAAVKARAIDDAKIAEMQKG